MSDYGLRHYGGALWLDLFSGNSPRSPRPEGGQNCNLSVDALRSSSSFSSARCGVLEAIATAEVVPVQTTSFISLVHQGRDPPKLNYAFITTVDAVHDAHEIVFHAPRIYDILLIGGIAECYGKEADLTLDSPSVNRTRT